MRIAIVGVGAMGCLFGARLSQVAEVMLVGHWPAQLTALRERGLRFIGPDGRFQTIPLAATDNPQTAAPADLALILVKSYQTAQAAETAQQLLSPNGVALTLQNGVGNLEQLTAVLGPNRANLGITSEGAVLLEPGVVRHAGSGHTTIADVVGTAVPPQEIVDLFEAAGFATSLSANVDGLVWGKLAINAGINPLTAVLQVPNGFLAENANARALMTLAAQEVAAVAAAQNIALPFADAAAQALAVAQATASNHSSMRQDLMNGRPTEIEAICGAVVAAGQRLGVATPVNLVLQTAVRQAEQGTWPDATPEANLKLLKEQLNQVDK
ncbi:MAG: 2-dehydropantoate 2-reductase [Ardenticatenaceae bacterium]|nr:2-dehydropantoate 2-reductase [Anaerolineales bacterium]MCB8941790.1 2-dehydropantoate 2-reductase [Ardenticatenaceae bacterium]MCB8972902.1 2-dehydropantoate 2-reductase [Ardenticatenaceae bacterium]